MGGVADERRKAADFELESNDNKKISVPEFQKKAGLGFDEMRILVATRDGFDIDPVAADLLGECGQVRCSGHDIQLVIGARRRRANGGEQDSGCDWSSEAGTKIGLQHGLSK